VKILTVVGNRPQFIKAAAVSGPLRERHEELLVHTGQHYDDSLSRVFFEELGLARPDRELGIGGGSNTSQTARMLTALEPLMTEMRPDAAIVYGDTNSTLAGALAAAQAQVPVVHVEAGMRSFERDMPEELNRVLADHLSELLLCPSETAAKNLQGESVSGRVEVVGDVMVDVAMRWAPSAREDRSALDAFDVEPGAYLLMTAHRAGNVDNLARLDMLVRLVRALPVPIVFPLHPRTQVRLEDAGLLQELEAIDGVTLSGPLGYVQFSALVHQARAVVTDSGGVQKEAYLAGVPCVTLRVSTEWVETVESGWNTLVDLDPPLALAALHRTTPSEHPQLYGDGHAAERCVQAIDALAAGASTGLGA
jgi:UDP-N-acetylglucosamine 2-epimerase (non-hydrolysing)/UDP-GlcNAc3NAcA epimerase